MPIYEFYCPDNHKLYQFLARTAAQRDVVPRCPDNPAFKLQKQVSRFAIIGKAKEDDGQDPFAGLDDEKMEAMMSGLEGDMGALDEENPAPRQLGRLMRRMTDFMGGKTPPMLLEMARRLEAGEDPEKLEGEFGGMDEGGEGEALFAEMKKMIRHARGPARDPKLYEMSDWLLES